MYTSGLAAIVSTTDAAVEVPLSRKSVLLGSTPVHELRIVNEGTVAGFFSIDGGTTWSRMSGTPTGQASNTITVQFAGRQVISLYVKRIASGTDIGSIYAYAW
jgi:hypothetical protein